MKQAENHRLKKTAEGRRSGLARAAAIGGLLAAAVLVCLLAPLPRHTVRSYRGIWQCEGTEQEVQATLDYWTFDFWLLADRWHGALTVERGGERTKYPVMTDFVLTGGAGTRHDLTLLYYNAEINGFQVIIGVGDESLDRLLLSSNKAPLYTAALGTGDITPEEVLCTLRE